MPRAVPRRQYRQFLQKAEENVASALENLGKARHQAAAVNAIHGAVNACDALTVYQLAQRASGAHDEIFLLLEKSGLPSDVHHALVKQIRLLLSIKNQVEYQPTLLGVDEARQAVRAAERLLAKARTVLPFTT